MFRTVKEKCQVCIMQPFSVNILLVISSVTDGIHLFSVVSVAEGLACDWLFTR